MGGHAVLRGHHQARHEQARHGLLGDRGLCHDLPHHLTAKILSQCMMHASCLNLGCETRATLKLHACLSKSQAPPQAWSSAASRIAWRFAGHSRAEVWRRPSTASMTLTQRCVCIHDVGGEVLLAVH
eukprot:1145986-Pelagomonas_calceolata.AAC.4